MSVTRRDLFQILAAISVGLVFPFRIKAQPVTEITETWFHKQPLHIQIPLLFPIVKEQILRGQLFTDDRLDTAVQTGEIKIAKLAPITEYKGQQYFVSELSVPLVWAAEDDAKASSELAYQMIENSIYSSDDMLADLLNTHNLIISEQYRYCLGEPFQLVNKAATVCKLWTAFVKIPK